MARRRTRTSNFGVGARESHDSTAFYDRFRPPVLSDDDRVAAPQPVPDPFVCGDARHMDAVADGSVALVVTSPPYFAGKQYEEELQRDGIPSSYVEYLELLRAVLAESARKLEPGGRIAVNVANLGRKPYRSLACDVIRILEDDLGLLLRGELIWQKADGASGSCAWGSFRSATNPVLRDITERVVVASKGRFDRARTVRQRAAEGLPHRSTILTDEFLASTLDVWAIPPDSARRVGHPAPFPVELPERLIQLYTFLDDLVLDPFMGSGSSLVAAARLGRRYIGYDLDPGYVEVARRRVGAEAPAAPSPAAPVGQRLGPAAQDDPTALGLPQDLAGAKLAEQALVRAGFAVVDRDRRIPGTAVTVDLVALDADGATWYFAMAGPVSRHRGGLSRAEVVWRTLGRAAALRAARGAIPFVVLASQLPRRGSEGDTALRAAGTELVTDVVDLLDVDGHERLTRYAKGGFSVDPQPGFWTSRELGPSDR